MFKLIKEKIYYHENFFLKPMMPTNPYTNTPFELHNLYNIYLQLLQSYYILPIHIKLFMNVNFNLTRMIEKYEFNILNDVIAYDYKEMSLSDKYAIMREMLIYFKKRIYLNVPIEKLYSVFNKHVLEYYKAAYLPSWCSGMILLQLKKQMIAYHKKHPNSGKRNWHFTAQRRRSPAIRNKSRSV
jgi:hypothetical protein